MMSAPGLTSVKARDRLVKQLRQQGIVEQQVLDAINRVPRHEFVSEALVSRAYENTALPIDARQTISQPYMVAKMTEIICQKKDIKRVLEVGTGSGYQAAILAELVPRVYSVERIEGLFKKAHRLLWKLGYRNIRLRRSDGNQGWEEASPFDAIIVTAAPDKIPQILLQQLSANDGVMVIPVGKQGEVQQLQTIIRRGDKFETGFVENVSFVPMLTGEHV